MLHPLTGLCPEDQIKLDKPVSAPWYRDLTEDDFVWPFEYCPTKEQLEIINCKLRGYGHEHCGYVRGPYAGLRPVTFDDWWIEVKHGS